MLLRATTDPAVIAAEPEVLDSPAGAAPVFVSAAMRAIERLVGAIASAPVPVLISGETGVGKEVVARLLHERSPRARSPLVKVNCAALPAELLESELFGYERGAFTGALQRKPGKFDLANGGTLFLDEIGELPLPLQAKLLHVLQDSEFMRLGGQHLVHVDVRIVAATNRPLPALIRRGEFRDDLYYRLNVVPLEVPPLRARREAIPSLLASALAQACRRAGRPPLVLPPETIERLVAYHWPGNVRELDNLARRMAVLGVETGLEALEPPPVCVDPPASEPVAGTSDPPPAPVLMNIEGLGLKEIAARAAAAAEERALRQTLERARWSRKEAARVLKISAKTLRLKMLQYGLAMLVAVGGAIASANVPVA